MRGSGEEEAASEEAASEEMARRKRRGGSGERKRRRGSGEDEAARTKRRARKQRAMASAMATAATAAATAAVTVSGPAMPRRWEKEMTRGGDRACVRRLWLVWPAGRAALIPIFVHQMRQLSFVTGNPTEGEGGWPFLAGFSVSWYEVPAHRATRRVGFGARWAIRSR